jgi:hypothetical protein
LYWHSIEMAIKYVRAKTREKERAAEGLEETVSA